MSENPDLNTLVNRNKEILLSNGKKVTICQLKVKNWQGMLELYSGIISTLAVLTEEKVTDEYVKENLDTILLDMITTGGQACEAALKFLNYFISGDKLSPEIVEDMDHSEFTTVWKEIFEANRHPFVLKLQQLKKMGVIRRLQEEIEIENQSQTTTQNSSASYTKSDSVTNKSQNSQSHTPSKSRKRITVVKSGK